MMTVDELVAQIESEMQDVAGDSCEFQTVIYDGGRPDDFEIALLGTCEDPSIYQKFKALEGKFSIPFKYPNFVSRQNTIGLLTVADKESAYPDTGGELLSKYGGDFVLQFCFVEW